jgi:hypothetical protein
MLKKVISFVVVSNKSSTYPQRYASGFVLACGLAADLFEHPDDVY